ncbi:MAG: zinc ABC transporter substrate-binding protein [Rhodobacterales bacterium]|nr:zinc ABC transporter substrate-binding protein [Rhodobacterales bacterium]
MLTPTPRATLLLTALAAPVWAEAPAVLTDTAPIHSLVSQVMEGVGTPDLLLPPGVSPHDFQFRPSDAARLSDATVVIWSGHALAPWLEEPVETLATDAVTLELLDTDGWTPLAVRQDATFAAAGAEEYGEEEGHDHDHAHEGADPHAWLSPEVATVWLGHIAETLATADPTNADTYQANAAAAQASLASLKSYLTTKLGPVQGRPYVVPHDAYQYFEMAFAMPAAGAITLSDASAPGPARISELMATISEENVTCILTDPDTSDEWSALLSEGSVTKTARTDPDGISMDPGPGLYAAILTNITNALVTCLS